MDLILTDLTCFHRFPDFRSVICVGSPVRTKHSWCGSLVAKERYTVIVTRVQPSSHSNKPETTMDDSERRACVVNNAEEVVRLLEILYNAMHDFM